jgi:hypothetical protein
MNNLGIPAATSLAASGLSAQLEEQVARRLGNRVHGFRVLLDGDGLILRGRTRSLHAKQLVQHAVMELTDLPIRANEIRA